MFGTKELLELSRLLSDLCSVKNAIALMWGDLDWYENKLYCLYENSDYMAGFLDYLRGDYDKVLLADVRGYLVELETFFEDGNNMPSIEPWAGDKLSDEDAEQIYSALVGTFTGLSLYLGVFRNIVDRYMETDGKPHQAAFQAATEPQQKKEVKDLLPDDLQTDEAVKIFQKAIGKGLIEVCLEGLEWKESKAKLAYLCGKIYGYKYQADRNMGQNVPYESLERIFNVSRLDRALQQVYEAQKPQRWRISIDNLFND